MKATFYFALLVTFQEGAKRVRGKRGRGGVAGKHIVFGMLKRDGKVYTQLVNGCSAKELLPILQGFSDPFIAIVGRLTMA